MLVLSRKTGETVRIGAEIHITLVEVEGQRIRLGIEAPRHIPIVRGELVLALPPVKEQTKAEDTESE